MTIKDRLQKKAKNWYDDLEDLVISFRPKPTQWAPWTIVTIVYPTYENKNTGTISYNSEWKFETTREFSRALEEIIDLFPPDIRQNLGLSKVLAPRRMSEEELKNLAAINSKKNVGACIITATRTDSKFPQFSEISVDGKNWTIAYEPHIHFTKYDIEQVQRDFIQ